MPASGQGTTQGYLDTLVVFNDQDPGHALTVAVPTACDDSPMRMRTAALVGGWGVALGLATAVSWAGVNLVGSEVSPSGSVPLSQAEVESRIHAASVAASPSDGATGAATSTSAGGGPPAQQSVVVVGGTVVLVCAGDQVTAKTSPRSGYTVSEASRTQSSAVEVSFDDGSHHSQVDGACLAGVPTATVRETDHGQDD
jgi:hypothetical protein